MKEGYGYFISDADGILEIEKDDEMNIFSSDHEAVKQAVKDGVKLIPIEELPPTLDERDIYEGYIDTEDNRQAIIDMCKWKNLKVLIDEISSKLNKLDIYEDYFLIKYVDIAESEIKFLYRYDNDIVEKDYHIPFEDFTLSSKHSKIEKDFDFMKYSKIERTEEWRESIKEHLHSVYKYCKDLFENL